MLTGKHYQDVSNLLLKAFPTNDELARFIQSGDDGGEILDQLVQRNGARAGFVEEVIAHLDSRNLLPASLRRLMLRTGADAAGISRILHDWPSDPGKGYGDLDLAESLGLSDEMTNPVFDRLYKLAELLKRVQELCQHTEGSRFQEFTPLDRTGRTLACVRVRVQEGHISSEYLLGVVDGPVQPEHVDAMVKYLNPELHRFGPCSRIVYTGTLPEPKVLAFANQHYINLTSIAEYSKLIDFRPYLEAQRHALKSEAIYRPELYVDQYIQLTEGEPPREARRYVQDWLQKQVSGFMLVLGDFGTGKTFLMHQLARDLGREDSPGYVPILVRMQSFAREIFISSEHESARQRFLGAMSNVLIMNGLLRFEPAAFEHMLTRGKIALLLDGYDEMLVGTGYDETALDFMGVLFELIRGSECAKIVLTCRSQRFLSEDDVHDQLQRELSTRGVSYEVVTLCKFNDRQIVDMVERLAGKGTPKAQEILKQSNDVHGLMTNPRMLSFIVDLPPDRRRNHESTYRQVIDKWLTFEIKRQRDKHAYSTLTKAECLDALRQLAAHLWKQGRHSDQFGIKELRPSVQQIIESLAQMPDSSGPTPADRSGVLEHVVLAQVATSTLLIRVDSDRFEFVHGSVPEWIIVDAAMSALQAQLGGGDYHQVPSSMRERQYTPLMLKFCEQQYCSIDGLARLPEWTRFHLKGPDTPANVRTNARQLAELLGIPDDEPETRADQDLRSHSFANRKIPNSAFVCCDLSGASLRHAEMPSSDLSGSIFTDADLDHADLRHSMLYGASFKRANLTKVKMKGAQVDATTSFVRAKLLGATLPDNFAKAESFGAALTLAARISDLSQNPELDKSVEMYVSAMHPCSAFAWAPATNLFVTAEGTVAKIWDAETGQELRWLRTGGQLIRAIAVGRYGKYVFGGLDDGNLIIWNSSSGAVVQCQKLHEDAIRTIVVSHDGAVLWTGSDDRTVIESAFTGHDVRVQHRYSEHRDYVTGLVLSKSGDTLVTCSQDGRVLRWRRGANSPSERCVLPSGATAIAMHPLRQEIIAIGLENGQVAIWRDGDQPSQTLSCKERINRVCFSESGLLAAATRTGDIFVWNASWARQHQVTRGHIYSEVRDMMFAPSHGPERQDILVTAAASGPIHRYRLIASQICPDEDLGFLRRRRQTPTVLCLSPDGRILACGTSDGVVALWDTERNELRTRLERHGFGSQNDVECLTFTPDGQTLLSGARDTTVRTWECRPPFAHDRFTEHGAWISQVATDLNGEWSASGTVEGRICVRQSDSSARRWLDYNDSRIVGLLFGTVAHELTLTAVAEDGRVSIWDVRTGGRLWDSERVSHSTMPSGRVAAVASNPTTGCMYIIAESTCYEFVVAERRFARPMELWRTNRRSRPQSVTCAVVSQAAILYVGSEDRRICPLDLTTGKALPVLQGHDFAVRSLAVSSTERLYSLGADGFIIEWDLQRGCMIRRIAITQRGWVSHDTSLRWRAGGDVRQQAWYAVQLCSFEIDEIPELKLTDEVAAS